MQHIAEAWTWLKAVEPAWVSAGASLVGAILASGLVVRWYLLGRVLRGSGAAIIALLGESEQQAHAAIESQVGALESSDSTVYFEVGEDRYRLCMRDLDRLHALGYVYPKEGQYHLSRLGHLLLERHDNARPLANGVARAKRASYLRCSGRLWLRCRCEKFWIAGHPRLRVPFPLGQWLTARTWRKVLG